MDKTPPPGESREENFVFQGQSASGHARQHNGNVYNNANYHYSLRKRRSDETLRESDRDNALLTAAANGHTARVEYLLGLGADVDHHDERGFTALHHAAYSGWEDTVDCLLAKGANSEAQSDLWGTPLHLAAIKCRANVVKILLDYRAVVHARSHLLGSPLHCACLAGDLQCATTLLERGADPSATEQVYTTRVFQSHSTTWTVDSVEHSEGQIWECEPLVLAIYSRSPLLIQSLATDPARVNAKLRWKWLTRPARPSVSDLQDIQPATTLFAAASFGLAAICSGLLDKGADADAASGKNWTALAFAAAHGDTDTCCALLSGGADINAKIDRGWNALMCAILRGHNHLCHTLLGQGADPNSVSEDYQTPLMIAAGRGFSLICRDLLESGAEINASTPKGETALLCAIIGGSTEVCHELLSRRINVDACTDDGQSALRIAVCRGYRHLVSLLLKYHAPIKYTTRDDRAPVTDAIGFGHLEIVTLLVQHDPSLLTHSGVWGILLHVAVAAFCTTVHKDRAIRVTTYILTLGINPLGKSPRGETPLAKLIRQQVNEEKDDDYWTMRRILISAMKSEQPST